MNVNQTRIKMNFLGFNKNAYDLLNFFVDISIADRVPDVAKNKRNEK